MEAAPVSDPAFVISEPQFDVHTGTARFSYALGEHRFVETLRFPLEKMNRSAPESAPFSRVLNLAAAVLGVSYYKLRAPLEIDLSVLGLTRSEQDFALDVYENGLGEFFARNELARFGRLELAGKPAPNGPIEAPILASRALVLIGGGKDSLVSLDLLERAGIRSTLFAVNPKGPILSSAQRSGHEMIAVTRRLDSEMIRLGTMPGYYNGHVPSTAINSIIAALAALLYRFDTIVVSNERSASEGNLVFDGRETNHQYSKSLAFEAGLRDTLAGATGNALSYFSLLRPYSEARIAALFARSTRFDDVFSSCNRNFRLAGHNGELWCGKCPKCHFVFLVLAPAMEKPRLEAIFGHNLLDAPDNIPAYRELTGLSGHKPWECVGEILEAAACLYRISDHPDWRGTAVVATLRGELESFYGREKLKAAYQDAMTDSAEHLIPEAIVEKVAPHAH